MTLPAENPIELGLPHRDPFLFVDRVLSLEPPGTGLAQVFFPADTPFFAGHFPGQPIVPGVILSEALAQIAGLVAARLAGPGAAFRLSAIRSMKFPQAALPEETLQLHANLAGQVGELFQFEVRAETSRVGCVAEGTVVLNRV